MSIGIRMHDLEAGSLEERAGFARAQGFQCVHLALSKSLSPAVTDADDLTPELAQQVRRALGDLDVAVLGCYLNLAHPQRAAYHQMIHEYTAHLRLCRWIDAGMVGTETGNPNAEYRFEPETSHSEGSLSLLIDRLAPVLEAAEGLGAIIALEPVYRHIVYDAKRARRVLDAFASPNLKIIFDPVNLLDADHLERRELVIAEAMELLENEIAVIHAKDYVLEGGKLKIVAAGAGEMDYRSIAAFAREKKPGIQVVLENTRPENAASARQYIANVFEGQNRSLV